MTSIFFWIGLVFGSCPDSLIHVDLIARYLTTGILPNAEEVPGDPYEFWLNFEEQLALTDPENHFSLLTLKIPIQKYGRAPHTYVQRLTVHREKMVERALNHFEITGELITEKNSKEILGISYRVLIGLELPSFRRRPGIDLTPEHLKILWWKEFRQKVNRRLEEARGLAQQNLLGFARKSAALREKTNSPIDVAEATQKMLEHWIRFEELISAETASKIGFPGDQLFGLNEFSVGRSKERLAGFSEPQSALIAFETGRQDLLGHWPPEGLSSLKEIEPNEQRRRLENFSLLEVRVGTRGKLFTPLEIFLEEHRTIAQKKTIERLVNSIEDGELEPSFESFVKVSGYSWDRLVGNANYSFDSDSFRRHQRIFSNALRLMESLKRALTERLEEGVENPAAFERLAKFPLAWLKTFDETYP